MNNILPTLEDYRPQLNFDVVAESLLKDTNINQSDFKNAKQMIWSAAQEWLPRDMEELSIQSVEQEQYYIIPEVTQPTKMYIDVVGISRGGIKPFDAYVGKKVIIDWKTRDGGLDQRWKDRHVDSWQWRIYSAHEDAALFIYRGISRRYVSSEKRCDTKEIILSVPPTNKVEVEEYILGQSEKRNALISAGLTIWPRNWDRCNDYGRECQFYNDCIEYNAPRFIPIERPMSYSRWKSFDRCNEYHRRMEGTGVEDSTEESNFGNIVHKGLAELWRQLPGIKVL